MNSFLTSALKINEVLVCSIYLEVILEIIENLDILGVILY